jgi:hypothetical protein
VGRVATRYVFICEQVDDLPIIIVLQINQALRIDADRQRHDAAVLGRGRARRGVVCEDD